jgi:hypothetical protein
MKESEFHTKRLFLEVNDEIMYFKQNEDKNSDIEDSINLVDLYDPKLDNADEAKCCNRVTYEEFPSGNSLTTIIPAVANGVNSKNASKSARMKTMTSNNSKLNPVLAPSQSNKNERKSQNPEVFANYCLTIFVPDEARWRICQTRQADISKLHLKVLFSILKKTTKNKADLMDKFIGSTKVGSVEEVKEWSWDEQMNWGGKCRGTTLQSPIDILTNNAKEPDPKFRIQMHLTDVHTLIKKNFKEVIVTFIKFGGIMKLTIEGTYTLYTPQYMSFRFPGETIINGKRSEGDILLNFAELSSERVKFIILF